MPKHKELENIKINDGVHRLCLDKVVKGKYKDEYAFVWRGNKVSKDGFVLRPAYFGWKMLGQLIKKAFKNKKINKVELKCLLFNLTK